MRPFLTALALAAGGFAASAVDASTGAVDLLQVYRLARAADPVLAAAGAARHAAHEDVRIARAPLWPQAVLEAGTAQRRDDAAVPWTRNRHTTASVRQVLFDRERLASLREAQALADGEAATHRAAEQALVVRVAQAYFDVLSAAESLAIAQANEAAFGQQVEQADHRHRHGLSALVDLEQARAFQAVARSGTIAARERLAQRQDALAEIIGGEAPLLAALRSELPLQPPQPADAQAWVDGALRQNPSLQARERSVDAAAHTLDAARAGHWPTLSAALDVGRHRSGPGDAGDGRTASSAGVVLSVPLFAGGATESRVRRAVHRRDEARHALEQRRRRVAREVREHHRGVVTGIAQVQASGDAVLAAEKALASIRAGHGLGTHSMPDLLLAIQTLGAARQAHAASRHQYVLSRLLLQQAAGTVDETDLVAVNDLLR